MGILHGYDWNNYFNAILGYLNSVNPYAPGSEVLNPPWVLFLLMPFVLAPYGEYLFLFAGIAALAFIAYRQGASPWGMAVFFLCPLVIHSLSLGNVEWLTLLGLVVTPPIGIVLLALKPQMTICVIAFIVIETWRETRWIGVARLLAPVAVLSALSIAVFSTWFPRLLSYSSMGPVSLSFFPWSVPIGVVLFAQSLRTRDVRFALAASPMFAPSITPQCWMVVFLALLPSLPRLSLATLGAWGYLALVQLNLI